MELLAVLNMVISSVALASTIMFICIFPIEYKDAIMLRRIDYTSDKVMTLFTYAYLILAIKHIYTLIIAIN